MRALKLLDDLAYRGGHACPPPLYRDGPEALSRDRLERIAERGDVLGAEALGPVVLDVLDQAATDRLRLAAAISESDDLRAPVGRVGDPLQVATPLEIAGDLAD